MNFLESNCSFNNYSSEILSYCEPFQCDNSDLNYFFSNDCINYSEQLLGKSYCFTLDTDERKIVCDFTISNDSIKLNTLPNARRKRLSRSIPSQKRFNSYPAVLIGRLGVNQNFGRKGIGCELLDFIKSWFIHPENKTGCRFIVVDSYNTETALNFYKKMDLNFYFLLKNKKKKLVLEQSQTLKTRLMVFDLIKLTLSE